MTIYLPKWTPFRLAWTYRSLRQGALNVGNDYQNKANLLALAITQANTAKPGTGVGNAAKWAVWRVGFGTNGGSLGTSTTTGAGLLLQVPLVPGFVPPVGTNDDGT